MPVAPLTAVTLVVRPYPAVAALNHVTQTISSYLDSSGMIPLDQACSSESIQLLDRLWENSDPIAIQSTGWSFCHHLRADIHYYRHQFTKSLRAAVKCGDLDIVKWILNHFSGCQAEVEVVEDAARYGRLEMLQYFLEYERQEIQEVQERNVIFASEAWWADCNITVAIEAGFPDVARWFSENVPEDDLVSRRVMSAAVRQGDMATIHWLLGVVYKPDLDLPPPALDDAAAEGNMEILQWIFKHGYDGGSDHALEEAATNGRLDMVQWLVKGGIMQGADKAVERACGHGHLPIVQWLFECDLGRDAMYTMYNAVHGGHLDIVKYLDALHIVDVAPNMMKEAAANGHLHIVQWLCEKYQHQFTYLFPPFYSSEADDGYSRQTAMDKAATNGHFDVLKFLHSLAETMKVEGKTGYPVCSDWAFSTAAVYGHFEIVKWLYQHYPEQCRSRYTTNMAARSGRLEILKWLHEHTDVVWTTSAMNEAAEKGHLSIVKWLHENRKEGCTTYAMDHAAHYGHLDVLRFLHYNRREGCSERAMDLAARERHFEILLFLRAKRTESCTMGAILATQGHENLQSWIKEHYPNPMWNDEG